MLLKAPEGNLRICKHGNGMQYYVRNNPKDFNGSYICEKDFGIARELAQKDYVCDECRKMGIPDRQMDWSE